MLRLDLADLAPPPPQLPHRRLGALTQATASAALHVTLVVIVVLVKTALLPGTEVRRAEPNIDREIQHLVFLTPAVPRPSGGGGGGGHQERGPIRRAQGVGSLSRHCASANAAANGRR